MTKYFKADILNPSVPIEKYIPDLGIPFQVNTRFFDHYATKPSEPTRLFAFLVDTFQYDYYSYGQNIYTRKPGLSVNLNINAALWNNTFQRTHYMSSVAEIRSLYIQKYNAVIYLEQYHTALNFYQNEILRCQKIRPTKITSQNFVFGEPPQFVTTNDLIEIYQYFIDRLESDLPLLEAYKYEYEQRILYYLANDELPPGPLTPEFIELSPTLPPPNLNILTVSNNVFNIIDLKGYLPHYFTGYRYLDATPPWGLEQEIHISPPGICVAFSVEVPYSFPRLIIDYTSNAYSVPYHQIRKYRPSYHYNADHSLAIFPSTTRRTSIMEYFDWRRNGFQDNTVNEYSIVHAHLKPKLDIARGQQELVPTVPDLGVDFFREGFVGASPNTLKSKDGLFFHYLPSQDYIFNNVETKLETNFTDNNNLGGTGYSNIPFQKEAYQRKNTITSDGFVGYSYNQRKYRRRPTDFQSRFIRANITNAFTRNDQGFLPSLGSQVPGAAFVPPRISLPDAQRPLMREENTFKVFEELNNKWWYKRSANIQFKTQNVTTGETGTNSPAHTNNSVIQFRPEFPYGSGTLWFGGDINKPQPEDYPAIIFGPEDDLSQYTILTFFFTKTDDPRFPNVRSNPLWLLPTFFITGGSYRVDRTFIGNAQLREDYVYEFQHNVWVYDGANWTLTPTTTDVILWDIVYNLESPQ